MPMTAQELYGVDAEFRSLIARWVADKRCPLVLADKLSESGLEGQSRCAEWCSWYKDRPLYDGGWSDKKSGVFPSKFARDYRNPDLWFWVQLSCIYDGDSDGVPLDIDFSPKIGELFEYFFTPESAIIALLD